jgi:hypothetical protein
LVATNRETPGSFYGSTKRRVETRSSTLREEEPVCGAEMTAGRE